MNSGHNKPAIPGGRDLCSADDAISLIDLALVLFRRKWVIMGILIACSGLGLLYALFMTGEPSYRYTTVIELARMHDGNPLGSSQELRNLMIETYIPLVREQVSSQYEEARDLEIDVSIPHGSQRLLQISSQGTVDSHEMILSVHSFLFEKVKNELDAPTAREKGVIEHTLKVIAHEIERLKIERQRIVERIKNAEQRLETGRLLFDKAPQGATDEVRAMTLLLIQSQMMEDIHTQLLVLEEQLYNKIPGREIELNQDLKKNQQKLDSIISTNARVVARQSDKPVGGTNKILILVLSVVLGGMLGVFGAYLAEFTSKVKEAVNQRVGVE